MLATEGAIRINSHGKAPKWVKKGPKFPKFRKFHPSNFCGNPRVDRMIVGFYFVNFDPKNQQKQC